MSKIMVDIAFLQTLASRVDQLISELEQEAPYNRCVFSALETGWQGDSRLHFDEVVAALHGISNQLVSEGQQLSQGLRQEITILEYIERDSNTCVGYVRHRFGKWELERDRHGFCSRIENVANTGRSMRK